jgi:hypothetical protein
MKKTKSVVKEKIPAPTLKHVHFYEFLCISPSFYKVHQYKQGKIPFSTVKKLEQYKKVLGLYEMTGDVFDSNFERWWTKGGYRLFKPDTPQSFLCKINLSKSLEVNLEAVKKQYVLKNKNLDLYSWQINFEKNKCSQLMLKARLSLINRLTYSNRSEYLENHIEDNKKKPNWYINFVEHSIINSRTSSRCFTDVKKAIRFGIDEIQTIYKKNEKELDLVTRKKLNPIGVKRTEDINAIKAKRYLSMLMSKNKREALLIAENAARGIFPSKNKILKKYEKFDFEELRGSPHFDRDGFLDFKKRLEEIEELKIDAPPFWLYKEWKKFKSSGIKRQINEEVNHQVIESILENDEYQRIIHDHYAKKLETKYKKLNSEVQHLENSKLRLENQLGSLEKIIHSKLVQRRSESSKG